MFVSRGTLLFSSTNRENSRLLLIILSNVFFSGKRTDQLDVRELFLAYNSKQVLKEDQYGGIAR